MGKEFWTNNSLHNAWDSTTRETVVAHEGGEFVLEYVQAKPSIGIVINIAAKSDEAHASVCNNLYLIWVRGVWGHPKVKKEVTITYYVENNQTNMKDGKKK